MTQPPAAAAGASDQWTAWAHLARPLFKWAGGKQRFLWENRERLPQEFGTYHEPFGGGLSVFFHLAARSATPVTASLGDVNLRIVRTYEEVKWNPADVSDRLRQLEAAYNAATDKAGFFNDVRAQHNRIYPGSDAARFIFLMNTAWNGVFRINRDGAFNVPHGDPKGVLTLPTRDEVLAASVALSGAKLRARSWESSLNDMHRGDFAFFDPPYYSDDDRRDLYERNRLFTPADHARLADALVELKQRGVNFLLTNSPSPAMLRLYRDRGLQLEIIDAHRSINSNTARRGAVGELVVTPGGSSYGSQAMQATLQLLVGDIGWEQA